MSQGGQGRFVVPPIYDDLSDQGQGYFQFEFRCPECDYAVKTSTQRSSVATKTRIMDLGVGLLGGFWGRAAEQGEEMFGSQWEKEKDQAVIRAWDEIIRRISAIVGNVNGPYVSAVGTRRSICAIAARLI